MQFVNKVFADPNVYDEFFKALDPEAPLVGHLLKFKEMAKYPDERETQLSERRPIRFMAKRLKN